MDNRGEFQYVGMKINEEMETRGIKEWWKTMMNDDDNRKHNDSDDIDSDDGEERLL